MIRRHCRLNRRRSHLLIAMLASAGCASAAAAQQSADKAPEPAAEAQETEEQPSLLDEIVVTGKRADTIQVGSFRGARVLDTPLTVAVMSRDLLDAQQATNLGDVIKNTPGVSFSQVSPAVSTNLTVRGIQTENRTNYRLNGGLPVVNLIDMPIEAFERVEVLKGVSSLYYGFTTPAGIINMIAKRPDPEGTTTLNLFGNSGGGYGVHADFGRMNDAGTIGFRVNLVAANPDYGVDRTSGSRRAATAAVDFKPADAMNLRFDAQYIHKDISEPAIFQLSAVGGVITLPPLLDPARNLAQRWMKVVADEYNLMGHFDWRFAKDWEIVLEAGISDVVRDRRLGLIRNLNRTTGNATLRVSSANGLNFQNRNHRGEIAGGFETGPLRHQLTLGVTQNERIAETAQTVNRDFAYNILTRPLIAEVPLPARVIPNPGKITDLGFYAFDRISYGEIIDVLLGFRRTHYKNISRTSPAYRVKVNTLSGGLVIKPTRTLSIYGTYIEGLEEGGVAPQTVTNPGEILPPNESTQKEVGVKWEPRGGLLFTAGYFHINRASTFVNAANTFVQDGRTVYKGIEASLAGTLTDHLNVTLSGTRLNARQRNAADLRVIGKMPENTAKYTASAFVDYKIPGFEDLAINGGAFYTGRRAVNNSNQAFIPAYTTYSLGARYTAEIAGTPVIFRVAGENITNKRYFAATGASLAAYGLPRLVKFSMGINF